VHSSGETQTPQLAISLSRDNENDKDDAEVQQHQATTSRNTGKSVARCARPAAVSGK